MYNVLINAYTVAPNWGSEQGMGWNWISNLAQYCNLYVVTEGEWQKEIDLFFRPTGELGALFEEWRHNRRFCDSLPY